MHQSDKSDKKSIIAPIDQSNTIKNSRASHQHIEGSDGIVERKENEKAQENQQVLNKPYSNPFLSDLSPPHNETQIVRQSTFNSRNDPHAQNGFDAQVNQITTKYQYQYKYKSNQEFTTQLLKFKDIQILRLANQVNCKNQYCKALQKKIDQLAHILEQKNKKERKNHRKEIANELLLRQFQYFYPSLLESSIRIKQYVQKINPIMPGFNQKIYEKFKKVIIDKTLIIVKQQLQSILQPIQEELQKMREKFTNQRQKIEQLKIQQIKILQCVQISEEKQKIFYMEEIKQFQRIFDKKIGSITSKMLQSANLRQLIQSNMTLNKKKKNNKSNIQIPQTD